ncbi:MAG: ComEA family DNA-binding protein [Salinibacter sp.]
MSSTLPMPRCVWPIGLLFLMGGWSPGLAQPLADSTTTDTLDLGPRVAPLLDNFGTTTRRAEQVAERFARLQKNPLNLNRASAADLSGLPTLSASLAHRIVRYRSEHGPFERLAALRAVKGVSPETLRALRPFLTVSTGSKAPVFPSLGTIASNLEFSLIQRYTRDLDLGRGYQENRFLGPPGRLTTRLRLEHERRLQLALTLDKDPGEPLRWAPATDTYGFDHVAGSLALRDLGPVKTLILGDFSAQFGQGLALWQGIRLGKGRDPVSSVLQSGRGLLPYRSASEANFFRGAALTVGLSAGWSLSTFASHRNRDASLDSSLVDGRSSSGPLPVRTVSAGGRHRTPSEVARKGTFGETTVGAALEYQSPKLHAGATGYYARFNRPLRPGNKPYRRYRVSGRHTSTISAYATAYLDPYTLFGEGARTPNGAVGGLLGASVDVGERAKAIVLARHYPPQLATFYGNAFGDGGRPQNETGVYTGLRLRVSEDWTLGAYFDQFRSPWLGFNVPRPATGWEARTVLTYEPRPWLSTYLQLRAQGQEEGTEHRGSGGRVLEGLHPERRSSARWHMEYTFSDAFTVRTRVQLSHYNSPTTSASGFYLSQGLRWVPFPRLQFDARLAFFDTEGFAARIYAYEHDLLYSFSVPVFFDRGRRSYLLVEYAPLSALTLEAKYGITSYANRTTIGSGLNRIQGASRRSVGLQIRWTL